MLTFDEERLVDDLRRASLDVGIAFAAAIAERLFPSYDAFSNLTGRGNPIALYEILSQMWEVAEEGGPNGDLKNYLSTCIALIPSEADGPWAKGQALAEDAAAATAYCIRYAISRDAREAAWAARRACDAVDHLVIDKERWDVSGSSTEQAIIAHPLMQQELLRQSRDLEDLRGGPPGQQRSRIRLVRDRARLDAANMLV